MSSTVGGLAPPRKRGRPQNTEVPERIEAAARELFQQRGFAAASIRMIASRAGSSAAVVLRHFGSKERLFLRTMPAAVGLHGVVAGPESALARTILENLLLVEDSERIVVWRTLTLAGDQQEIQSFRREALQVGLSGPLALRLTGPHAEERARLAATQIAGLLLGLWVDEDPVLTRLPTPLLIDLYAPTIQVLIDSR